MSQSRSDIRIVLVTGLSGAGKSSALKTLEDLGYEAVDNLPLALLGQLAAHELASANSGARKPLAIGIDSRTRDFSATLFGDKLAELRAQAGIRVELLFLDADDAVLRQRFSATRRRHPLAYDRAVSDGISHERELLAPLRDQADRLIDTSLIPLPELRREIAGHYRLDSGPGLTIMVTSFSYRRGLPREADLVFDVRFLDNPYYQPGLAAKTGEDPEVGAFVAADPVFEPFFATLADLLMRIIPQFGREGRQYLTIAIGCTGGRHRSVYTAGRLAQSLGAAGYRVALRHRDRDHAGE